MKHNYLIYFLFLLFIAPSARATHLAGADISYEFLTTNSQGYVYRVYVTTYRDCEGIPAPPVYEIKGKNMCNGFELPFTTLSPTDTLLDGKPNGTQVGGFCPGNPTSCGHTAGLPGYEEWRYVGYITLPTRCDSWRISCTLNDRNYSDNLMYAAQYPMYLEAMINNVDAPTNKSPFFTVKPTPYICNNEEFDYNHGVIDPDGDSVSYQNTIPLRAFSWPMDYAQGYSLTNPIPTRNGYFLDTRTGQTTFTPTRVGKYATAVRVYETRNGKIIGYVTRDIQTIVRSCATQKPTLQILKESFFGGAYKDSVVYACADIPLRFCLAIKSLTKASILIITDNHKYSVPFSSVSYTGQRGDSAVACFFWRPTSTDVGFRLLTVVVRDSSCALYPDVIDRSYTIPIVVRPANKNYQLYTICPGGSVDITGSYQGDNMKWSSLDKPDDNSTLSCINCLTTTASPDSTAHYLGLQDMGGGCINTDTVEVRVDYSNSLSMSPSGFLALCSPEDIKLSATALGNAPLQRLSCGVLATPPTPELDTAVIYPSQTGRQQSGPTVVTPFNGSKTTGKRQYLLRKEDLRMSGMYSGALNGMSIYFQSAGSATTYENVRIAVSCTKADTLSPSVGFLPGTVQVFSAGSITIPQAGGWYDFNFSKIYARDTSQNLLVEICYNNTNNILPAYAAWLSTPYAATMVAEANIGNLCATVPQTQPISLEYAVPMMRFSYYLAPSASFSYQWRASIRNAFLPSATDQNPTIRAEKPQIIYVSSMGRNGCRLRDSLDIYVAGSVTLPTDTAICKGNKFVLSATTRFGKSYQWYEDDYSQPQTLSCNNCATPEATPTKDVRYTLILEDSIGCIDTFIVAVTVNELGGQVRILNNDTTVNFGSTVQLQAVDAFRYEWEQDSVLSAYDIPNPIATPTGPVVLKLTGYTEDGCRSYDSIRLDVDYRGRIFVPDAFTPNGDGKNDLFRVVNFSFQELLEFKVFNRWGELVFTTTDGTAGWDGTYNGHPQPIGTYFYMVRVRFKDNTQKQFIGDVTLIR